MKEILFAFTCLFSLVAWIGLGYWWGHESVVCPSPCGSYEAGYWEGRRQGECPRYQCQMPDVPFTPLFDTANLNHYSNE